MEFFFADKNAPKPDVGRDAVEGRVRKNSGKWTDWRLVLILSGGEVKEHSAPSILAFYLVIPLVIPTSLEFGNTHSGASTVILFVALCS